MSDEQQNSRLDSLINIVKALLKIDPLVALIALLVVVPMAIPLIQAILGGDTGVVTSFVLFISGITVGVYIPLIIVRAWRDKEKRLTDERTAAINKEMASRLEDKKHSRELSDRVVNARLTNIEAQTKAIIDNIPHFERILLHEEAAKIREVLDLDSTDKGKLNSRLGLVVEAFESINRKYEEFQTTVPELKQTIEEIKKKVIGTEIEGPQKITELTNEQLVEQIESMAVMISDFEEQLISKDNEIEAHKLYLENYKQKYGPADKQDEELMSPDYFTPEFAEKALEEMKKPSIPARIKAAISTGAISIGAGKLKRSDDNTVKGTEMHDFSVIPVKEESELKDALEVVDNMEDSEPEPIPEVEEKQLNYWLCAHCGNKNALKAPRCRKCSKGKKYV